VASLAHSPNAHTFSSPRSPILVVMKRHVFQRWAIWLLPLMLVRAFVPAGFMLSAQAGELSLVFCSGSVTAAQSHSEHLAHQHHAGHSADASAPSSESDSQSDSEPNNSESNNEAVAVCPFAASGTAAITDLPYFVGQFAPLDYEHPISTLSVASDGPQRAEHIRGPPALI
jgi:hypothetical protein